MYLLCPFLIELPQVYATPRKFSDFPPQVAWMSRYSKFTISQVTCFENRRTFDASLGIAPVLSFALSFSRALAINDGNIMRRLSLRSGEASVLAHALALWVVDACLYILQEVRGHRKQTVAHCTSGIMYV